MNAPRHGSVLMLLDDAAVVALLDASCALARLMQRELRLVFVESSAARRRQPASDARAGPSAPPGPLAPEDVWRRSRRRARVRSHGRARQCATRWAGRCAWCAARSPTRRRALRAESDLLLLGAAPARASSRRATRAHPIVVLDDGSEAGWRSASPRSWRRRWARGWRRRKLATQPATAAQAGEADLLVLPAAALGALPADRPHAPLLPVGAA